MILNHEDFSTLDNLNSDTDEDTDTLIDEDEDDGIDQIEDDEEPDENDSIINEDFETFRSLGRRGRRGRSRNRNRNISRNRSRRVRRRRIRNRNEENSVNVEGEFNFGEGKNIRQRRRRRNLLSSSPETSINTPPMSEQQKLETEYNQLVIRNKELNLSREKLQDEMKQQERAYYIASNFDRIDEESFKDLHLLDRHFNSEGYPQVDLKKFRVVRNENQMENVVNEAQSFKNIYKPGDIVTDNSSFNITRDNICYRANGKPMKVTKALKEKYPDCMVCNTIAQEELKDSDSWRNTRTNINEVCLFNPDAKDNSGIPNLEQCKKMCKI